MTSGLSAIARAARRASASLAAPVTRMSITLVPPSASATIWCAKLAHTASRAASNAAASADPSAISPAPFIASPLASSTIVSLVDMCPSTVRRLKVAPAARTSIARRTAGSIAASVARNASVVAMFGAIMPTPFADPPIVTVRPAMRIRAPACFGRVSVVRIARAKAASALGPAARRARALGMPGRTFSIGRKCPMTPVDATRTASEGQPISRATSPVISSASARPRAPVQTFAFPLEATTPRIVPRFARWARLTWTGAPVTLLVVKTAAALASTSQTRTARSGFRLALMPQVAAPARNPLALVTPIFASTRVFFAPLISAPPFPRARTSGSCSEGLGRPHPSSGCPRRR